MPGKLFVTDHDEFECSGVDTEKPEKRVIVHRWCSRNSHISGVAMFSQPKPASLYYLHQ
jgi:hypothetical protein